MNADQKPYLDFDLQIEKIGRRYRARATTPFGGVSTVDFSRPFTPDQVKLLLLRVGRTRLTTRATPGRVPLEEIGTVEAFGRRLYEKVFTGDVRSAFDVSLSEAHRRETGLRIRLRLGAAPDLADLPWEYLAVPGGGYFSLSRHTPVVRYLDLAEPEPTLRVDGPLRMLVMVSNPLKSELLDVETEWARLVAGLDDVVQAGQLSIDRLETASLSALRRRLERNDYHILHFVGHGGFDPAGQAGLLLLEDEFDAPMTATADDLAIILDGHASLRLAVLNSCEGSRSGTRDPFSGTAQTLVRRGLPAVVAMQFEITDVAATNFARGFYSAIGAGFRVDAAVAEGRKEILANGNRLEWGTPSLFMRSSDGLIFGVRPAQRVIEPPSATVALLEVVGATDLVEALPLPDLVPAMPLVTEPEMDHLPALEPELAAVELDTFGRSPRLSAVTRATARIRAALRHHPRRVAAGVIAVALVAGGVAAAISLANAPSLATSPSALDFGTQALGTTAVRPVTISSNQSLQLDSVFLRGSEPADFGHEVCPEALVEALDPCEIQVSFAPLGSGIRNAELVLVFGGRLSSISMAGTGVAPNPSGTSLSVHPEVISFESLEPSTDANILVENVGSSVAQLERVTLAGAGVVFQIALDRCTGQTLDVGGTCQIQIHYAPDDAEPDSATIAISSDVTAEPLIVNVTGPGVATTPSPSSRPSPTPVRTPRATVKVTPKPTPTPTVEPTTVVTPPPTRPPTPAPTAPPPKPVGNYKCLSLNGAKNAIQGDGFSVGTVTPSTAPGSWYVHGQSPAPGTQRVPGTAINLGVGIDPCAAP